jgi:predicted Rossmann-fold nucleotide-binding protein
MVDWMHKRLLEEKTIDADDVCLLRVTDDPAEVVHIVQTASHKRWADDEPGSISA